EEDPGRVSSIVMLSAIGVQELELLSTYHLNHAVHGFQLAFFWLLEEGFPHFGFLDDAILNTDYARNFFDTDQRPLRDILKRYQEPMLILHGKQDFQVPFAAAQEHARIVPQSELVVFEGGHELAFTQIDALAAPIADFVGRTEQGRTPTRANAEANRRAAAEVPFDPADIPQAEGSTLVVLLLLIGLATLVSEDLTSIGAGFLIAQGTMDFFPAMLACFVGIFFGDVLLFLAGRFIGRPLVRRAPFRWIVSEAGLARGEAWLAQRGPAVIMASRFLPGTRLPTYVAAGLLRTGFWQFSFYFLLASAVWTPLLVGLSVLFGNQMLPLLAVYQNYALPVLVGTVLVFWLLLKTIPALFSHRGRRLLLSAWRRKVRWEFWPPWFFYLPVVLYVVYLALRYRSLTLFTAANPAMPAGGFIGESKAEIMESLREAGDAVARFAVIEPDDDPQQRAAQVSAFMNRHGFGFPIVLKPDVGERGADVAVLRSSDEVQTYLARRPARALVQQYAPGLEFGVFYYRYPDEADGHIFSITDKQFPVVTGDGWRTLERLILDDDRAVAMARVYLAHHRDR
ncbi:MAG: VTT domain-containing protein, partial [Rhodothermales bacterium]